MCGNEITINTGVCPYCNHIIAGTNQKPHGKRVKTVNIKQNLPTSEEASFKLKTEIDIAKSRGIKVLKIIHGYGSTGEGGVIRKMVHQYLKKIEAANKIHCFIPGESFTANNEKCRQSVNKYSWLKNDSDMNKNNKGITVVIF